jgi:hypothetical protein
MRLSKSEKSILDHLVVKGAATRLELAAATGFSKSGVRNAIRTLVAGKRVKQHVLKREEGYSHRHRTFIAAIEAPEPTPAPTPEPTPKPTPTIETVNVFEHPEIYSRLHELETQLNALAEATGSLGERLDRQRDSFIEYIEAANVFQSNIGVRLRALEPQPKVDPLYTEIERDITETLGGKYSPKLLRGLIDSAYAERKK